MKKILSVLSVFIMLFVSCGKKIEDSKKSVATPSHTKDEEAPISNSGVDEKNEINKLKEQLFNAIDKKVVSVAKEAITNLDSVDFLFENGETPLTYALLSSNSNSLSEVIKDLLIKSRDLNLKNESGLSPLHLAILKKNKTIFKKLIKLGVDVNLKNDKGESPLIATLLKTKLSHVVLPSEEEIVLVMPSYIYFPHQLLLHGAKVTDTDSHKFNAIHHLYLLTEQTNFFEDTLDLALFIAAHDKVSNKNINNAIKSGKTDFLDYLLFNFNEYRSIMKKRNLLITAINIEDEDLALNMVTALIKKDPSIINNTEGIPALIHATIKNKIQIIKRLSLYKPDFTVTDEEGKTALNYAVDQLDEILVKTIYNLMSRTVSIASPKTYLEILKSSCESIKPSYRRYRRRYFYTTEQAKIRTILQCDLVQIMQNDT